MATLVFATSVLLCGCQDNPAAADLEVCSNVLGLCGPDTVDWHRYYPLEVGNLWEYSLNEDPPRAYTREEVIGETTIGHRRYYRVQKTFYDIEGEPLPQYTHTTYLRYDRARTVVGFVRVEDDTSRVENYLDVGAAFGDTLQVGQFDLYYTIRGCYRGDCPVRPDGEDIPTVYEDPPLGAASAKLFYSLGGSGSYQLYLSDIGLYWREGGFGPDVLRYARIGGREYGQSVL